MGSDEEDGRDSMGSEDEDVESDDGDSDDDDDNVLLSDSDDEDGTWQDKIARLCRNDSTLTDLNLTGE